MTAVLVDSNVLLDVITEDATWCAWSSEAVANAADRYCLVVNPIIYAEVSVRYSYIEDLEVVFPKPLWSEKRFRLRPHFWQARLSGPTVAAAVQNAHHCRISSSTLTRRSRDISC